MNDEIKEIKIGMYSTDEILEFMTNGEGRGFMGRSMYDAILDYITNLQEELEEEKRINQEDLKLIDKLEERIEKAVEYIGEYKDYCDEEVCDCTPEYFEYLLKILNGRSDE